MAMVMTDADAATATATADAATATATATADAATATVDADSVTATAAEKPKHAEKPDYAPYNGASTADGGTGARVRRGGGVVDSVVARWRREDMLDKSPLALHAAAAVFAFVALVLVASNQHGDWMQFDRYQEYKYLLSIASLALLYSLAQAARHAHRMRGGVDPISSASGRLLDFVGDQVVAYLLMSALSAAAPITNRMRSAVVNNFTDATAAAISMTFFAFAALALSAVVSGYKLSKQTYM
ncbi:CASP-like protein 4B1 [Zea mays]|uniref:CASP-like protein n=1 Tax=Zea mays TaxID=4577 RepID=A0A804R903_MAIZE|nr:CASP-like protein 4B1 [Zea mays]|eukprot:XP_008660236.1 CASP-like protein 4B1 [Zea mays]